MRVRVKVRVRVRVRDRVRCRGRVKVRVRVTVDSSLPMGQRGLRWWGKWVCEREWAEGGGSCPVLERAPGEVGRGI